MKNPIYPGNLAMKRWIKIATIMTAGLSLFINDVQNRIFEECQRIVQFTDTTIAEPIMKVSDAAQSTVLPLAEKFEQSTLGQWLKRNFDVLPAKVLKDQTDYLHDWGHRVHYEYVPLLRLAGWSLKVGNWILIIVIVLSYFWLFCDIISGPKWARWLSRIMLLVSLPLNLLTYFWLSSHGLAFFTT